MTTYRWGFEIIGMNWVDGLSYHLHGPDIAVLREEDDDKPPVFLWTSEHLSDLEPGSELASRAGALKTLFDGAMYLIEGASFNPEKLGELIDLQKDRRTGVYGATGSSEPFSTTVVAKPLDERHRSVVSDRLLEGSIFTARSDQVVRGMLNVLGTHGVTLPSLYALRDFMNSQGFTDAAIAEAGGSSKSEFTTFRRTANSFAAVGVASRHGLMNQEPPAVPMTLERAAEIILSASRAFISTRILAAKPDQPE